MRTPAEIVEARWPGWAKEHMDRGQSTIPLFELIKEGMREAFEEAALAAEIEDDGEEIARICREKARRL